MGYQNVRALTSVRHNGVLRIPGQTSGDNAQDFVAEDSQVARLVALGVVTALGVAAAPADPNQASGSSSASVVVPFASRALTGADNNATLVVSSAQTATVGVGLGLSAVHFSNPTTSAVSLTITGAGGAVINGAANGTITRSIPANTTLTVRGVGTDSVNVPGSPPGSVVQNAIYEYDDLGNVRKRAMVRPERILKQGNLLWWPTVPANTAAATYAAYSGPALLIAAATTSNPVEISFVGGYSNTSFTGLSVTPPSDGLMQLMLWVPDWESGDANPLGGGLNITLTMANGTSASYNFSTVAVRPGWNTVQLWNPLDADQQAVLNKSGISYTSGTPTITYATTISSIALQCNSPVAASKLRIGGLYSQTVVKPMICMTFDTSNPDVFDNFCPVWIAAGLKASLRAGGNNANRDSPFFSGLSLREKCRLVYDKGMDVFNGSWSRLGLSAGTTEAQLASEVGLQTNWQNLAGLPRGGVLFSSAGNGLAGAALCRKVMPKFGVTLAKTGGGAGRIKPFGPAGLDDRLAITSTGWPGRTAALQQIRVLQKTGGIVLWFAHQCEIAGAEPPPDSASPGSGGGMYYEDAVYFASYFKALQASGAADVVGAQDLSDILDGVI